MNNFRYAGQTVDSSDPGYTTPGVYKDEFFQNPGAGIFPSSGYSSATGKYYYFWRNMAEVIDGLSNTFAVSEYTTTSKKVRAPLFGYTAYGWSVAEIPGNSWSYIPDFVKCGDNGGVYCQCISSMHGQTVNIVLADGSVRAVSMTLDKNILKAFSAISDSLSSSL